MKDYRFLINSVNDFNEYDGVHPQNRLLHMLHCKFVGEVDSNKTF